MLLGHPLPVIVYFIVDEFLYEDLVIVGRTRPQHCRLTRLHWWAGRGRLLDHLQVDPLLVVVVAAAAPRPLDLRQLRLDLTETVGQSLPSMINPSFDGVGEFAQNIRKNVVTGLLLWF